LGWLGSPRIGGWGAVRQGDRVIFKFYPIDFFKGNADIPGVAGIFDRFHDRFFGAKQMQSLFVGWVFVAFGEDVTDRVFPAMGNFDFNQFGFG
jgi:hypothetical protein